MAGSSIGRAALVLTANGSALRSGLEAEKGYIRSWADSTSRALKSAVAPALGAAASLTAVTAAVETIQDLGKQGQIAKALGLTGEQFTGIAAVAKSVGEDTREFLESLVTMGKLGTDAARGTEQASQAFAALGLNADQFIKLRTDEQFFAIFQALEKVPDPLQRTRLLMQAFGEDGGKYLLPLLAKSSTEIRGMAGSLAVSNGQMDAATRAAQSFARAQLAIQQLWRRIVIAAAPVLEFLASEITHTVNELARMGDVGVPTITRILRLTAQLADATKAVTAATLIATGARLKFANAEILVRGAIRGGLPGLAAAGLVVTALEATIGPEMRQAGGLLMDVGKTMLADVGNSSKRVETFIKELETRDKKGAAPGQPNARGGGASELADAVRMVAVQIKSDNAALIKGTEAEASARARYAFSSQNPQIQMVKEQKEGNKTLKGIETEVKKNKGKGVELLPM